MWVPSSARHCMKNARRDPQPKTDNAVRRAPSKPRPFHPHNSFMTQHGERCFSLLTSLYSLLAFGRSGLFGPPLCGGSAPATPPPKTPAAPSEWQNDLDDPLRPGLTPHPTPRLGRFPVCASAGKVGEATPNQAQPAPLWPSRTRYRNTDGTFPPGRPYTELGLVVAGCSTIMYFHIPGQLSSLRTSPTRRTARHGVPPTCACASPLPYPGS